MSNCATSQLGRTTRQAGKKPSVRVTIRSLLAERDCECQQATRAETGVRPDMVQPSVDRAKIGYPVDMGLVILMIFHAAITFAIFIAVYLSGIAIATEKSAAALEKIATEQVV